MKRFFDIVISVVLIMIFFPLMVLVALAIFFSDLGPALYKQDRVGLNGKVFKIIKFRSMRVDADRRGGYSTEKNDPRITLIGKFIRKTSVDELPQLFNVLLGDMSIVGPRPDVPQQRSNYSEKDWLERISVIPGITGLAQATLRSEATNEQRLQLDLNYINNQSFMLDVKIIVLTIKQVLVKGGN